MNLLVDVREFRYTPAPEGPADFPTGWFDSRERIDAWFAEKPG